MKRLIAIGLFLLFTSPLHAMSLTDQLIMESRIQNQLRQQQSIQQQQDAYELQRMKSELEDIKRNQSEISKPTRLYYVPISPPKNLRTQYDDSLTQEQNNANYYWLIQNRPELLLKDSK